MASEFLGIEFEPLGRVTFRPPSPFEAGIHGPGARGASYSYPLPSTISGILSSIAYREKLCSDSEIEKTLAERRDHPFPDQELCLSKLLGGDFNLRPGFLMSRGRIYAHIGSDYFPEFSTLRRVLGHGLKQALENDKPLGWTVRKLLASDILQRNAVRTRRSSFTGIALDRNKKTVQEGMLYTLESIAYEPNASILALAIPGGNAKESSLKGLVDMLSGPVKFGKRWSIADLKIRKLEENPLTAPTIHQDVRDWALILLTPALVTEPLTGPGDPLLLDESLARKVAKLLLEESSISRRASGEPIIATIYTPKLGREGQHDLSVIYPGWSIAAKGLRRPMLLIPAGTAIILHGIDSSEVITLATRGVGCCSNLGWGTVLPIPLSST